MDFKDIAQEVRVWAALKDYSGDPYGELWSALEYFIKLVELPGGTVKKIAEGEDESGEKTYIIFERVEGGKLYRLDAEIEDSWDRDRTVFPPYEVVAKEVTEVKYLKV